MSRFETLRFINAAHFFDHFFLLIFPTAALAIARDWGMTYAEAMALGTPIYVMFAVGTLPAGCSRLALPAMAILDLVAVSPGPASLMIGLGLLGLFAALYHPVGLALVIGLGGRTGSALAVNGVAGNLGLAGAAVFTGVLATLGGWQTAFAAPGVASLTIGATLFLRHRRANFRSSAEAPPQKKRRGQRQCADPGGGVQRHLRCGAVWRAGLQRHHDFLAEIFR